MKNKTDEIYEKQNGCIRQSNIGKKDNNRMLNRHTRRQKYKRKFKEHKGKKEK